MAIYDYDGTTNREIGKVYDYDGAKNTQIGEVYDYNGSVNALIYEDGLDVYPNTAYKWGVYDTSTGNKVNDITFSGNVLEWSVTNDLKGISPTISFDLTGYSKLTFVVDSISGAAINSNHRVGFYTSRKVYGAVENSTVYQKPITKAGKYEFDLTGISGVHYIIAQLHSGETATVKISSIRLE
ncbi:MAG: hypothetical protein IKA10_03615 [Oscillospiraceae bacterium]|nr:hypothetical protein [Oscillospiraceae bacterium]